MQRFKLLLFLLLGYVASSTCQNLTPPPACGAACLEKAILASPCGTNQTCICLDEQLTATAQLCVLSNCTTMEALSTKNYSMVSCGQEYRDESWKTLWLGMSFFIFSTVAFTLRLISRVVGHAGIHADDYAMIVAMACATGFAVTSIPLYIHKLGRDIWAVPFDDITKMLLAYYHGEWVYALAIFFTKLSLLLFYLRVFPAKSFRIQVYCVGAVLAIYSILAIVISVNQCTPVRGAWLYWSGEEDFSCLDRNALGWSSAVINMALDISIMILPLRPLSKLVVPRKKKIQLILMFLVGAFVTVVSIIRLQSLIHFSHSTNATWDYRLMGYWSQIEIHVGNFCACMPGIYSLMKKLWPSLVDTTKGLSGQAKSTKGRSHRSQGTSQLASDNDQNFIRLEETSSKGTAY